MTHKSDVSLTLPARHPFVPSALFCAFALLVLALPLHAQLDIKGSTDHPLFPNRMPGFRFTTTSNWDTAATAFMDNLRRVSRVSSLSSSTRSRKTQPTLETWPFAA